MYSLAPSTHHRPSITTDDRRENLSKKNPDTTGSESDLCVRTTTPRNLTVDLSSDSVRERIYWLSYMLGLLL